MLSWEANLSALILTLSEKKSALKGKKNCSPWNVQESRQEVTKVVSLVKNGCKLPSVSSPKYGVYIAQRTAHALIILHMSAHAHFTSIKTGFTGFQVPSSEKVGIK